MGKQVNIDTTSVQTPSTPIHKPNFGVDVEQVNFTLPVKSGFQKIQIELHLLSGIHKILFYDFDYLPNVDINQYLQYVVNLYNNGVTTYPSFPPESSTEK